MEAYWWLTSPLQRSLYHLGTHILVKTLSTPGDAPVFVGFGYDPVRLHDNSVATKPRYEFKNLQRVFGRMSGSSSNVRAAGGKQEWLIACSTTHLLDKTADSVMIER